MIAPALLLVTLGLSSLDLREGVAPDIEDIAVGHTITDRPGTDCDPLWLVRTTNRLISLGKPRAIAIVQSYERRKPNSQLGFDLYWLSNLMFEPSPGRGYIDVPRIGSMQPPPPRDMRSSPRFPILLQDGIPFNALAGIMIGGFPEPVSGYLDRISSTAVFRARPLVPANDPFESLTRLRASSLWPRPPGGSMVPNPDTILRQILLLVRTAYVPRRAVPRFINWDGGVYEKLHAEYLALKPRWDPKLQLYVRGDGTYDPIK